MQRLMIKALGLGCHFSQSTECKTWNVSFWAAVEALLVGRVVPRKGAPNVLLIVTDDTGFGAANLRRRDPDADAAPARQHGAALHELEFDGAVLAEPRGATPACATTARPGFAYDPQRLK